MFYDNLKLLCDSKGIKLSNIVTECGGALGSISGWKRGAMPNSNIVIALAMRLNVSTDYLLLGNRNQVNELASDERKLLENYSQLSDEDKKKVSERLAELTNNYKKNPIIAQNEMELLEIFQNFTAREQIKIIGKIEEWLEVKQKREIASRQQALQISIQNPPQAETEPVQSRQWRMTARRTDGVYESRFATPEEIEKLKLILEDNENNPEKPEY